MYSITHARGSRTKISNKYRCLTSSQYEIIENERKEKFDKTICFFLPFRSCFLLLLFVSFYYSFEPFFDAVAVADDDEASYLSSRSSQPAAALL